MRILLSGGDEGGCTIVSDDRATPPAPIKNAHFVFCSFGRAEVGRVFTGNFMILKVGGGLIVSPIRTTNTKRGRWALFFFALIN